MCNRYRREMTWSVHQIRFSERYFLLNTVLNTRSRTRLVETVRLEKRTIVGESEYFVSTAPYSEYHFLIPLEGKITDPPQNSPTRKMCRLTASLIRGDRLVKLIGS